MKNISVLIFFIMITSACSKQTDSLSKVNRKDFQTVVDGKNTDLFILKNKNGLEMTVTNYGARVVEFFVPDRNGKFEDIVLGHDNIEKYINFTGERFLGATIGRFGNRIADGKFTLDGVNYQLTINDAPNSLHGGEKGFDRVVWDTKQIDSHKLEFTYQSADGEQGYPGNLVVEMVYELTDDNEFIVTHHAVTDKRTVINLTHHSFFNLHGAGNGTGEIIDIWLPKLKASVYKIEDDDYGYIFRRSIDEILSTAFGDEYAHCWEQLRRVPDYIKNMERCLLGEDYNPDMFSLAIDLLPGTSCVVDDFTCGSRYTRWVKLYEFYDKFVNYYERNVSEEVESVKSEMYCSDKCIYTDTEGCSIGKLVDAIYSRALKRNDNIYDNWLQFCRLAQAWYAYLIKGTEIGGIPGLGMDICAYDSLISHDSVDYMAAAWLPNKNGNTSNKGRAKVNAKCIELFGDITEFLESSDETATEHDVAVNVVKALAIGQELMQKGNRERVVKLLRQAFSWKTSVDTEKCKATMQAILESYIKERRKQHKATRAFEILMVENN